MTYYSKKTIQTLKSNESDHGVCEQSQTNYNSFDLAKFICSILVVMIHIAPFGKQESTSIFGYINFVLQNGLCRMAVPLFFVFSGFFLYKKTPFNKFVFYPTKNYVARILYIYVIWSLIYFPLSLINITENPNGILFGFIQYIRSFLLMGSYTQLWYLNALIVAVVTVSFLLYKKWNPKKIFYTSLIFYVFGLLGDGYYRFILPLFDMPFIGAIIKAYFIIFVTTRNGVFFAFFFVSLGMILSSTKYTPSAKKSCFFFVSSLIMMCIESFTLKRFNIANDYNILLFAVPSTFFCFMFLKSLKLRNRKIYKKLRELSSLIFYGHMWIKYIVEKYIYLGENLKDTPVRFMIILTLTILTALIVTSLSNQKGLRWLKKIY